MGWKHQEKYGPQLQWVLKCEENYNGLRLCFGLEGKRYRVIGAVWTKGWSWDGAACRGNWEVCLELDYWQGKYGPIISSWELGAIEQRISHVYASNSNTVKVLSTNYDTLDCLQNCNSICKQIELILKISWKYPLVPWSGNKMIGSSNTFWVIFLCSYLFLLTCTTNWLLVLTFFYSVWFCWLKIRIWW